MNKRTIRGAVDGETRCSHYHGPTDIIALKCYCCREYFPCHACHEEQTGKAFTPWPKGYEQEKAVLCGSCKQELTIGDYRKSGSRCPECGASFNPGCRLHAHLYFSEA
ncbi:CHY zinc finger protein [Alkalicoccus luteus]|uniref:CHY zinc finger protein n=1 Tax=Alkalicoccus luteus TaxID=1237094 RepID=UPI0040331906